MSFFMGRWAGAAILSRLCWPVLYPTISAVHLMIEFREALAAAIAAGLGRGELEWMDDDIVVDRP